MPWHSLGEFQLIDDWLLSSPVDAEIFRIHHKTIIADTTNLSLRAVVAQGFMDSDLVINRFNPKIFTYNLDSEIFAFYFPYGLTSHSLMFKRLDSSPISWRIEAEYFASDNPEEDYRNYLYTRFGQPGLNALGDNVVVSVKDIIMSLYPRGGSEDKNLSLAPESDEVKLKGGVPKKLVKKNYSRKKLTIRTGMHSAVLATGFNDDNEPIQVIETIPPNYNFDLPSTDDAIFQGEIWALAASRTFVAFTEYSIQEKEDTAPEAPVVPEEVSTDAPVENPVVVVDEVSDTVENTAPEA